MFGPDICDFTSQTHVEHIIKSMLNIGLENIKNMLSMR
jgi:hypothetical protein